MSLKDAYTDEEWRTLQFALLAAFYAVAFADGKVSRLESATLQNVLNNAPKLTEPQAELAREVLIAVNSDFGGLIQLFDAAAGKGLTFQEVLIEARTVVDTKAAPDQARTYKQVVVKLATLVAEAAFIGTSVTPEERASVERVSTMLGL